MKSSREALNDMEAICSKQEKCISEAIKLLNKWGIDGEEADEVINQLVKNDFINENRFASAFIRDKIKFSHWGLYKVRFALKEKGIPSGISEDVINLIDKEEYRGMIKHELQKKLRSLKGNSFQIKQKLLRFGTSRGYETELLYNIIDDML